MFIEVNIDLHDLTKYFRINGIEFNEMVRQMAETYSTKDISDCAGNLEDDDYESTIDFLRQYADELEKAIKD